MKKVYSGKMTSKGQVTIPQEIRQKYQLSEGDRLEFMFHEQSSDYMTVIPSRKKSVAEVAGSLSSPVRAADLSSARKHAIDQALHEKYGTPDGMN